MTWNLSLREFGLQAARLVVELCQLRVTRPLTSTATGSLEVVLSHAKTMLGLCTAKADFGRYLKLSVQPCVTATQLSQNRDLLKQLPHRNSAEQAGGCRTVPTTSDKATDVDCDWLAGGCTEPFKNDWARFWDCALQRLILAVT